MDFDYPIDENSSHFFIYIDLTAHVGGRWEIEFFRSEHVVADPGNVLSNLLAVVHVWLVSVRGRFVQDCWGDFIPELDQAWESFLALLLNRHLLILDLKLLGDLLGGGAVKAHILII